MSACRDTDNCLCDKVFQHAAVHIEYQAIQGSTDTVTIRQTMNRTYTSSDTQHWCRCFSRCVRTDIGKKLCQNILEVSQASVMSLLVVMTGVSGYSSLKMSPIDKIMMHNM